MASLDRGHERGNIDKFVPGRVHDHNARLREPEPPRIDERPAIGRRGAVQRDHVARGEEPVQPYQREIKRRLGLFGERIMTDD